MAPDVKAYANAIERMACLFALGSVVPVILESRFGNTLAGGRRPRPPTRRKKKQRMEEDEKRSEEKESDDEDKKESKDNKSDNKKSKGNKKGDHSNEKAASAQDKKSECKKGKNNKKDDVAEEKADNDEDSEEDDRVEPIFDDDERRDDPLGILSALLLVASEVVACHEIFFGTVGGKKSKSKTGIPGAFGVLITGVATAMKAAKANSGTIEKASSVIIAATEPAEAFATAHSLLMLVALSVATVSLIGRAAKAIPQLLERGGYKILRNIALLAAVVLFAACNNEALAKTGKALLSENLVVSLQLPLRVAGLISATLPGQSPQDEFRTAGGTPPMFAALQAASLAASLSASIASGELAKAVAPFTQQAFLAAAWDSKAFSVFGPLMLGLTWLALMHLQKKPGCLTLAAMLSCVSSPILIATAWPKLAPSIGLKAKDYEKGFLQLVSLTYAAGAGSLFVTGGTSTLIAIMFLGQVLVRIFGLENLSALFA